MCESDSLSVANSFVGRGRELGELRGALDEANTGRGRLFVSAALRDDHPRPRSQEDHSRGSH